MGAPPEFEKPGVTIALIPDETVFYKFLDLPPTLYSPWKRGGYLGHMFRYLRSEDRLPASCKYSLSRVSTFFFIWPMYTLLQSRREISYIPYFPI